MEFCNLARRIKLLAPMFEAAPLSVEAARALAPFLAAVESARELLRLGSSKIYLVLGKDTVMNRFQFVTSQFEAALDKISFDDLDISVEIREQVEITLSQFKKAKELFEMPDAELYNDLSTICNKSIDASIDPTILKRLAEKLQLMTICDLTQESMALRELMVSSPGDNLQKMLMLLARIKDLVQTENPEMGAPASLKFLSVNVEPQPPEVPDEFRCSAGEHSKIVDLVRQLSISNLDSQRSAAGELCHLARESAGNRVCIAEAGAIPQLVSLLSTSDPSTQVHAVTALLNLSIVAENKKTIIESDAVPALVRVLSTGSMVTRENAAAVLFCLSVAGENKVTIGECGAIPGLAALLSEGRERGKMDAARALFLLCLYRKNKVRAVKAGVVPTLMRLIEQGRMLHESLPLLGILAGRPEGRAAIGAAKAVPVLVDVIRVGSPKNKENATAVLVHLCGGEEPDLHIPVAQACGVEILLNEMVQSGTDRGKRKASELLECMDEFWKKQKKQALALARAQQSRPAATTVLLDRQ